jgi:hypothetical protein
MAVALVFERDLVNLVVVEVEDAVGAGAPRGLDGSSYLAGWGIEQRLGYHRRRWCFSRGDEIKRSEDTRPSF